MDAGTVVLDAASERSEGANGRDDRVSGTPWLQLTAVCVYIVALGFAVTRTAIFILRRRRGEVSHAAQEEYLHFWCIFGCLYNAGTLLDVYAEILHLRAYLDTARAVATVALAWNLGGHTSRPRTRGAAPRPNLARVLYCRIAAPYLERWEPEVEEFLGNVSAAWEEAKAAVVQVTQRALIYLSTGFGGPGGPDAATATSTAKPSTGRRENVEDVDHAEDVGQRLQAPVGGDEAPLFSNKATLSDAMVRPVLLPRVQMQEDPRGPALEPEPAPFSDSKRFRKSMRERGRGLRQKPEK